MNRVSIRDTLVAALEAWKVSVSLTAPTFYENTEAISLNEQPDVFFSFAVDFLYSEQINISPTPDTRYSGNLEVTAYIRETLGTRSLLSYLDGLTSYFGYKTLGGVHLGVPNQETAKAPPGWYATRLLIPFFADSNA